MMMQRDENHLIFRSYMLYWGIVYISHLKMKGFPYAALRISL